MMNVKKWLQNPKGILSLLLVGVLLLGMLPQMALAATDVTLNFRQGVPQDGLSRYLLYFDGLSDQADKYWNNNTVYIDGKEVGGDGVNYLHLDGQFTHILTYAMIEEGVTAAGGFHQPHILQIRQGTALAGGEYTVAKDVWLKLDGETVTACTPVTLSCTGGGAQDAFSRFVLTFSGYSDTRDICWNNNTVLIDGEAVTGEGIHYLPDSGENINLYLYYSALESGITEAAGLGTHILEIPAGTVLGGTYVVKKTRMFRIEGSTVTEIIVPDVTVSISNDWRNAQGNCTSGLYFLTSADDGLPFDTAGWTARYAFATGGIYVNDELVEGARLVKITETLYYIAFDGTGVTFQKDNVVKIGGTVEQDGRIVAYMENAKCRKAGKATGEGGKYL